MITIDGSLGEGGGQIVRSSLALSLITGRPYTIKNVRAGRKKPGLLRQHLTAVNAAVEMSRADVQGNEIGSRELSFRPGKVEAGRYRFDVGTAGSSTLVFQTILPALSIAENKSELILEGGTHNPNAPTFDFLDRTFLPCLRRMGPDVSCILERPGYYPAGGGRFLVSITPVREILPFELVDRGALAFRRAKAVVNRLPATIAERELRTVQDLLNWDKSSLELETRNDSSGPGNVLTIEMA